MIILRTNHLLGQNRKIMTEIEFAAFLVSRVCHDLVGPLGAVVNGLEVLEDEQDPAVRADALRIVASSAEQALARLQFMRLAFGAGGSVGAEIDLKEIERTVRGLIHGGRIEIRWQPAPAAWPKDWAKLLMNGVLIATDCLPRGGIVTVDTPAHADGFRIVASGQGARISQATARALDGTAEFEGFEARGIQQVLAAKLAHGLKAHVRLVPADGHVEVVASL